MSNKRVDSKNTLRYDVIVVLAGGLMPKGNLPTDVEDRVAHATSLWRKNYAPKILMSGRWSRYWEHTPPALTEAALMAVHATSLGIPDAHIFLEEHSQNTHENIFYAQKLFFEPNNWKKIILITSDYHAKRVLQMSRRLLGDDYHIQVFGVKTIASFSKKTKRNLKEVILLIAQWFLQNFTNRK